MIKIHIFNNVIKRFTNKLRIISFLCTFACKCFKNFFLMFWIIILMLLVLVFVMAVIIYIGIAFAKKLTNSKRN